MFCHFQKSADSFFAGFFASLCKRIHCESRHRKLCVCFGVLVPWGRRSVVTENSANLRLMTNKSKPGFLVCFRHFWERQDLMKWKLSLASVAPYDPVIILIRLSAQAQCTASEVPKA